jgi:hypothetical protein
MGDHVYLAVEQSVIDHIIEQTPNRARYLVGVVEWEPGELNDQIQDGVWQVSDAGADRVMHSANAEVWRDLSTAADASSAPSGDTSGARSPQSQPPARSDPRAQSTPPAEAAPGPAQPGMQPDRPATPPTD